MADGRNGQIFERVIGLGLIASLLGACIVVTAPFIIPVLWGIVLAVSTWPLYCALSEALGGRRKIAAVVATLLLLIVTASPIALLIASIADNSEAIGRAAAGLRRPELPGPPAWLAGVPLVGGAVETLWVEATANVGALVARVQPYLARAGGWLVARGADLGLALVEFLVAIVITGILYVTAESALDIVRRFVGRIGGPREVELLGLAGRIIRGVAVGVIGTALAQGFLAGIGLAIAGAPGPVLLGSVVFMVALVQLPTAVVLLPVAGWLLWGGETWQGVFLVVWSLTLVNTVDNVIRPYLISQGADTPFLLMFVGVIGGLLAWGFLGIFLGATLLAVSYKLFRDWLDHPPDAPPRAGPPPAAVGAGTEAEETR